MSTEVKSAAIPTYHDVALSSGVTMHYITAGSPSLPTLLLLHGFPSSSVQFRTLIPLLSSLYHIVAPDLPGFGLTTVPSTHQHTFDNMALALGELVDKLQIKEFAMYIFDYGAPSGLRLAMSRPSAVKAIITQNGNAYEEGFGAEFWAPLKTWWASENPNHELREKIKEVGLTLEGTKSHYVQDSVPEVYKARLDPLAWHIDYLTNIQPEAKAQVQLDLFFNYRTNVALYPAFQKYLRESKVPVLAVWGKHDPHFIPEGAKSYARDVDPARFRLELLDGGHFLLATHVDEVAELIKEFLADNGY